MKVIGLDLSLSATGVAAPNLVLTVKPKAKSGPKRLNELLEILMQLYVHTDNDDLRADLVVLEGYAYNVKSMKGIRAIGELGGLIRWSLWRENMPYVEIPPASLKKFATGKGGGKGSDKFAVFKAALKAGADVEDADQADAWWLRQMGLYAYKQTCDVPATQYRDEAVAAITWPKLTLAA